MKLLLENWRNYLMEKDTKVSCKVLIKNNEGKIFIVKMTGFNMWDIPGGHAHFGEDFVDAAKREVKEETNLEIKNLKKIGQFDTRAHYADKHIFFTTNDYSGDISLQMNEVDEFKWVNPDEISKMKVSGEIPRALSFDRKE